MDMAFYDDSDTLNKKIIQEVIDEFDFDLIDPDLAELLRLDDPVELYLEDIRSLIPLTKEAEYRLVREVQNGNLDAKNKLINSYLSVVIDIASEYKSRGLHFLDLVQEGNTGLICAVNTFDRTKGCSFDIYVKRMIRRAIRLAIVKKSRIIRVPVDLQKKKIKILNCRTQLQEQLGREPTLEELACKMGYSLESIRKATFIPQTILSTLEDDFSGSEYPGDAPEASDCDELLTRTIHNALETLSVLESCILRGYFGFDDQKYSLDELGKELGLTQKQILQMKNNALEKLRHSSVFGELQTFCDG